MNIKASIVAIITFSLAVAITAAVLFIPVMFFAGPHSSVLPEYAQKITLFLAWLSTVLIPFYSATRAYKWCSKRNV